MKISIIIPAFNEEKLLPATLRAVQSAAEAFVQKGWDWELCVCDNNSTDNTRAIAEAAGARTVFEPINQISRARNTGASIATGDWLIFVDADSRPTSALFNDVIHEIESGRTIGGGVTVKMDIHAPLLSVLVHVWNTTSRLRRWAAGSFVYCSSQAFRDLGGFSTRLYATEEIEFSQRLKKMASQHSQRVVILHRHPMETSARKLKLYSKSEYARFFLRFMLRPFRTLESREECRVWYDGRR